jgi:hypothetical protein
MPAPSTASRRPTRPTSPGATNHVKVALAESLAGKPVTTPATRAYGCTVKYTGSDASEAQGSVAVACRQRLEASADACPSKAGPSSSASTAATASARPRRIRRRPGTAAGIGALRARLRRWRAISWRAAKRTIASLRRRPPLSGRARASCRRRAGMRSNRLRCRRGVHPVDRLTGARTRPAPSRAAHRHATRAAGSRPRAMQRCSTSSAIAR